MKTVKMTSDADHFFNPSARTILRFSVLSEFGLITLAKLLTDFLEMNPWQVALFFMNNIMSSALVTYDEDVNDKEPGGTFNMRKDEQNIT